MTYSLETTDRFDREFRKLDRYTQKMIRSWIGKHLFNCSDPRIYGKALTSDKRGLWRYRIGDYRLICMMQDRKLVILMLAVGHRSIVYKTR